MRFAYAEQKRPEGIVQAFLIGRDWIAGEACALALSDNLIHGDHLSAMLRAAATRPHGATVFVYQVRDPEVTVAPRPHCGTRRRCDACCPRRWTTNLVNPRHLLDNGDQPPTDEAVNIGMFDWGS